MGNLAIIPARGGSKRIPRKNIKDFLGKPIIAYSIEAAIESNLFDEVMVSTEDIEIAEIAKNFGAKVPFLRSNTNSNDFAVLADVILEVLDLYNRKNIKFENICCILPTAPFVTADKLKKGNQLLSNESHDCVFPILEFPFPIQRSLKIEGTKVEMVWSEYLNTRSQDIESRYHDSGQFYWIRTEVFLAQKKILVENAGAIIISQLEAQDIDTLIDWKLAEIKYQLANE